MQVDTAKLESIPKNSYLVVHKDLDNEDHIIKKRPTTGARIVADKFVNDVFSYAPKGMTGSKNSNFYEFLSLGLIPNLVGSASLILISNALNNKFGGRDSLFANMNGSAEDVFSISHEFGHCFAMWQQLKLGSQQEGRSMDVSEIHSQAMQMLTLPYYEIFYGEDAGTARKYDVYTMVAGILTAAMNDEFQEKIYENPQMTVQELNELYKELAMEYGLVVESPYFDMESFSMGWFTTNQYFDTPFYAIDYALSGCVAMEFLQMGLEDYTQALETYLSLVQQNSDYDFMTVLEETGLSSPFETE